MTAHIQLQAGEDRDRAERLDPECVIVYTRQCDLECAHCCTWSGPQHRARLRPGAFLGTLPALRKRGFRRVLIAGGEPFLCFPDVLQLVRAAREADLVPGVGTNCNWAARRSVARKTIGDLHRAGIGYVLVSIDTFHLAQMPLRRVLAVLAACKSEGIECSANLGLMPGGAMQEQRIAELLKRWEIPHSQVEDPFPVGRAIRLRPWSSLPVAAERSCPVAGHVTIDYDGTVYPCCAAPGLPRPWRDLLRLGNITTEAPDVVLSRLPGQLELFLSSFGPVHLLRQLCLRQGLPEVQHRLICESCAELFRPQWRGVALEYAGSRLVQIRLKCAALMRSAGN